MKPSNQKFYICIIILLTVGIGFVTLGLLLGASTSIYIDGTGFHLGKVMQDPYEDKMMLEKVENLDFDISFSKIKIIKSDHNEVEISGNAKVNKPEVELKNGTLKITSHSKKKFLIGMLGTIDSNNEITLYLKDDIKDADIELAYSNLEIEKLKIEEIDVESSFSNAEVDGSYEKVKFENNFGDIRGNVSLIKEMKLNNSFGNIRLEVEGKMEEYDFHYDNAFGDIKVNDKNIKNIMEGNGNKKIKLDNAFGDIDLYF